MSLLNTPRYSNILRRVNAMARRRPGPSMSSAPPSKRRRINSFNTRDMMSNFDFGSAFNALLSAVTFAMTKVPVIVAILLSTYLIFTCGPRYTTGIIGDFISGSNNTISNWILSNPNDFTGFLIFFPGVFAVARSYGFLYLLASFLWVSIVPQAQIYEYLIQSLGLLTLFQTNDRRARTAVLLVIAVAWFAGWFVIGPGTNSYITTLPLNNANISMHSLRK